MFDCFRFTGVGEFGKGARIVLVFCFWLQILEFGKSQELEFWSFGPAGSGKYLSWIGAGKFVRSVSHFCARMRCCGISLSSHQSYTLGILSFTFPFLPENDLNKRCFDFDLFVHYLTNQTVNTN